MLMVFIISEQLLKKFNDANFAGSVSAGNFIGDISQLTGKINPVTIYGGTGADGDLTVASGTTNIDLGGVAIFTKKL